MEVPYNVKGKMAGIMPAPERDAFLIRQA